MSNFSTSKHSLLQTIKYPLITDKSTTLLEENKYTFIVDQYSNKMTIKSAIEYLFNVTVIKVNTLHLPRKKKRIGKYIGYKSNYKKAIITLSDGNIINLFAEN